MALGATGPRTSSAAATTSGCLLGAQTPVNSRESAGNHETTSTSETPAFAGDIGAKQEPYALLAMQKVEGSNPFSRLEKTCKCQSF